MTTLLFAHVFISLVGILSGLFVSFFFVLGKRHESWMLLFLIATAATSLSGFLFPAERVTPGHIVGVLSLIALTIAAVTRNSERHLGAWSRTHIVSVLFSFYLNAFVLVVQSFQKIPALRELAPTGSEAPFAIAQTALLMAFVLLGFQSFRHNRRLQVCRIRHVVQIATLV